MFATLVGKVRQKVSWMAESGRWRRIVLDLVLLACVVWVTRFSRASEFGLYEDDFTRIPDAIRMTWAELGHTAGQELLHLGEHGRPLQSIQIYLLAALGERLGGLQATYLLGCIIVVINCFLFYSLLRRLSPPQPALLGALAYALFPADTTQAFLTHALGIQSSLSLVMLGMHAYLSGAKWLTYVLAILVLHTYETPYPLLLALPLLEEPWDAKWLRGFIRHLLILGVLLGLVLVVRQAFGESRVEGLGLWDALRIPVLHMGLGPLTAFALYFYRPVEALQSMDVPLGLVSIVAMVVFFWILRRREAVPDPEGAHGIAWLRSLRPGDLRSMSGRVRFWASVANPPGDARITLAGAAMVFLAYPLTFTLAATELHGRATRVHLAAVVGASMLFAVLVSIVIPAMKARRSADWALAGLAGMMALWLAFGLVVQRDYVESWRLQKALWKEIVHMASDVGQGTVVLVDPAGLEDTVHIGANTWNLPRLLERIYAFPEEWDAPPRVYRLLPDWREVIATHEGLLRVDRSSVVAPPSLYLDVDSGNTVLLESASGHLLRSVDTIDIGGESYRLREPAPAILSSLGRRPLFALLFDGWPQ